MSETDEAVVTDAEKPAVLPPPDAVPEPALVEPPSEVEVVAPALVEPLHEVEAVPEPVEAAGPPEPEEPARAEAPVIEAVVPDHGPVMGGTRVKVTGLAFQQGAVVTIGGAAAATTVASATQLEIEAPAGSIAGAAELVVENPDGQRDVRPEGFTFVSPPVLVSLVPDWAPAEVSATITLSGAHFVEGCSVVIGTKTVASRRINGARIEAETEPRAAGPVDVTVINPDGQRSTHQHALGFFEAPEIASIEPGECRIDGGSEVLIRGRNLPAGTVVTVGGARVEEVTSTGEAELRFVAPARETPGPVDIGVVDPRKRIHVRKGAFVYRPKPPPALKSVEPRATPNSGGARLVLKGHDFREGCAIFLLGIEIAPVVLDGETLEIVAPAVPGSGPVDVRVVNADGQAHTLEKAFSYTAPLAPPVLRAVSPNKGSQVGGLKVAVLGDDFAEGCTVRFGDVAAEVTFLTGKELRVVTPASAVAGEVPVEVVNPDGASARLEPGFDFEAVPPPVITSVSPAFGPTTGGTKVIIEGVNFTAEAGVFVDRERPQAIPSRKSTEIQIVMAPRKAAGMVDVEVVVPGLAKAVMKNAFRYDAVPAPAITSISPNRVGAGGGAELTIAGKNFLPDTKVLIDNKPPKSVKFVDKATLEVKLLPGVDGKLADVVVRNPDGKEAVQKKAFQYDARYG